MKSMKNTFFTLGSSVTPSWPMKSAAIRVPQMPPSWMGPNLICPIA